jgi:hypothetical protein
MEFLMHAIGDMVHSAKARIAIQSLLALFAIALCWADVSWALRPGLFPIFDELSTRTVFLTQPYGQLIHLFPDTFYADRPLGWAFIRLVADLFGFDYTRQVACLLAVHFANCGLAFLMFRRLGAGIPISIAGVALFGGLVTTAQTATYLGESFDAICLFFLLASTLALLSERRGATVLSAVLFLAALRSKEYAIVAPLLFTVLVALRLPPMPPRHALVALVRRLWMHYLILLVFGLRYLSLLSRYRAGIAPGSPYAMDFHVTTVLQSLAWFTAMVFGAGQSRWQLPPLPLALGLGAVLCWAILRRRAGVAFGVCAYVLILLPVCLIANRATFYAYAPQAFLILVLGLLVEEALASLGRRERVRWVASVCIALACLSWCVRFRRSPYFRSRVNWNLMVRRTSLRTARDVDAQLPPMGQGTHVYVNHNRDTMPWLFAAGPCSYLRLVNRQRCIYCLIDQPVEQLRALYASDPGEKYFVDYHDDGSITVAEKDPRR